MRKKLITLLLTVAMVVQAAPAFATVTLSPSTTLSQITGNNSSTSNNWIPVNDTRGGVNAVGYNPPPSNISGIDAHGLAYPGFNGQIFVHFLPWFVTANNTTQCNQSNGGIGGWSTARGTSSGHICNGYDSRSTLQIHNQMNDLQRRGFAGPAVLWSGTGTTSDTAIISINAELNARCTSGNCPLHYWLVVNSDATNNVSPSGFTAPGSNSITTTNQETTMLTWFKDVFCFWNKNFFGAPSFFKINGNPLWQDFLTESGNTSGAAPSWADMWTQLQRFTANLPANCPVLSPANYPSPQPNNGQPLYEWGTSSSDFTHDGLTNSPNPGIGVVNGAFTWENSNGHGVNNQLVGVSNALGSLDTYYTKAVTFPLSEAVGAVFKGFDDQIAGWSPNYGNCASGSYCTASGRITDQQCGMTWIQSWKKLATYFSTSKQLPIVQVITWNDYDEGTALETGIESCWSVGASMDTTTLTKVNWTLTTTKLQANLATINRITIWGTTDGVNMGILVDGITPAASGSFDLSTLNLSPATYTVYVQMQGQNSVINRIAQAGTMTIAPPPNPPPPPNPTPPPPAPPGTPGLAPTPQPFIPQVLPTPKQPGNWGPLGITIVGGSG